MRFYLKATAYYKKKKTAENGSLIVRLYESDDHSRYDRGQYRIHVKDKTICLNKEH